MEGHGSSMHVARSGRGLVSGALAVLVLLSLSFASCASSPKRVPEPAAPAPVAQAAKEIAPARAPTALEPAPAKSASISAAAMGLYRTMDEARSAPTEDELAVVASAKTLIGMAPNAKVVVNGRTFTLDCIGTVSAIFYKLRIDVTKDFGKYSGNGVNCLYMTLKDRGVLHYDKYPRVGDVIVWDNTWDANGDADRTNDQRTHAGVVLAVDDDGTIYYVHENMYKGVMIEYMNLLQPNVASDANGKRLNSSLAIATASGGPKPPRFLSGDVFDAFGDVLRIKDALKVAQADPPSGEAIALASHR
jgi:hypothetical protein